jgi:serine/threonine protein kinase
LQDPDRAGKIADREGKIKGNAAAVAAARQTAREQANKAAKENTAVSDDWQLSRADVTLTKELGRGTKGYVFLASFNGATVVAEQSMETVEAARRKEVVAEAEAMKRLCTPPQPNLLHFYGALVDDRGILCVSERAPLGTLKAYLVANPKAGVLLRLTAVAQVAAAMAHLHGAKPTVLHRYLAASNVLLAPGTDKNTVVAKLSGFGVARRVPRESDQFEIPPRRTVAMDRWAAPEVLSASTHYKASDVWSFGVLAWEVYANGATPYGTTVEDKDVADGVTNKTLTLVQPELCPTPHWSIFKPCLTFQAHNRPNFGAIVKQLAAFKTA